MAFTKDSNTVILELEAKKNEEINTVRSEKDVLILAKSESHKRTIEKARSLAAETYTKNHKKS